MSYIPKFSYLRYNLSDPGGALCHWYDMKDRTPIHTVYPPPRIILPVCFHKVHRAVHLPRLSRILRISLFPWTRPGITIPNPYPLSPPPAQNARVTGQQISFPKFTTILDGFFLCKGGLVRFRNSQPTACLFSKVRSRLVAGWIVASPVSGAGGLTTISWR